MRSLLLPTVVSGLVVSAAMGRNVIDEYSGHYQEGIHYSIVREGGNDVAVRMHEGSVQAIPWKFEAYDSQTEEPGYINYIEIQRTGDLGFIVLRVKGDVGHMYGARDVKRIDLLSGADNTTQVYSMFISGDFGENGPMLADKVGSVAAYGDLLGRIAPRWEISGDIVIGGQLEANIDADWLGGSVTVSGAGPHTGSITARQGDMGAISINGPLTGSLSCAGTVNGSIRVGGALTGNIDIGGSVSHWIDIEGAHSGNLIIDGDVSSSITIGGDFSGSMEIGGRLTSSVVIAGDVNDIGDNHIYIKHMDGGYFECQDLEIKDNYNGWMVLGHGLDSGSELDTEQTGTIQINGTLSGVLLSRSLCGVEITATRIDAGAESHPSFDYGGIYSWGGFTENFGLTVNQWFRNGWVYMYGETRPGMINDFLGSIDILGDMGHPDSFARIIADRGEGNPAVDLGAVTHISGDLYPSGDGNPAIYASGNLLTHANDPTVEIGGDMRGQLRIDGSVLSKVLPAIHVHGSVYGNPDNEPVIKIAGDLGSPIAIDGSLRNKPPGGSGSPGPEILVEGSFGDYGATAVDYDGWQFEDVWKPVSKVQVGQTTYSENTPAAHVWEIQKCKGDMNNDGWVDEDDLAPFILALYYPSQYEAEFPGLAGSMLYHGDCNCDGLFDDHDTGALLGLVGAGCCTTDCVIYWCEEYAMELGVLPVVEMLENAVSPRLRPTMVTTVSAIADYLGESDLGRFWNEVLDHLRREP